MKTVKILSGSGCSNCEVLKQKVSKVIADNNFDASIEKVTDIVQIMGYGVMTVPVLVIDEEIKCVSRIPSDSEIHDWLK
ncbi:MAG: thioredoxin family protein [Alphaproteobacteria bacterium]|nr:thioredoxin family protein [Alphaproteobacteria bacterium]